MEMSGVYKLSCGGCKGVYIGETGRQFKTRLKEHIDAWNVSSTGKSTFAEHVLESGHQFNHDRDVVRPPSQTYKFIQEKNRTRTARNIPSFKKR